MSTFSDLERLDPQLAMRIWRLVSIVGGLATVAAVSGLVVVAASKDADTLATIALPLAILAFLIQILVFAVQAWQSSEVTAKSGAILSEVSTKIATMESQLDTHVKELTRYAFEGAQKTQGVRPAGSADGTPAAPAMGPTSAADLAALAELASWPSDVGEAQKALNILSGLSPFAVGLLRRHMEDEVSARSGGRVPGLVTGPSTEFGTRELLAARLVERVDPHVLALYRVAPDGGSLLPEYRLTEEGRQVGRMLVAVNEPPAEIRELLEAQASAAAEEPRSRNVRDVGQGS